MLLELIVLAGMTTSSGLGFEELSPGTSLVVSSSSERFSIEGCAQVLSVEKFDGGRGHSLTGELYAMRRVGPLWFGIGGVGTSLEVERYSESGFWPALAVGQRLWRLSYQFPGSAPKDSSRLELRLRSPTKFVVESSIGHVWFDQEGPQSGWSASLKLGYRWGKR